MAENEFMCGADRAFSKMPSLTRETLLDFVNFPRRILDQAAVEAGVPCEELEAMLFRAQRKTMALTEPTSLDISVLAGGESSLVDQIPDKRDYIGEAEERMTREDLNDLFRA